jgi:hypothetical protein
MYLQVTQGWDSKTDTPLSGRCLMTTFPEGLRMAEWLSMTKRVKRILAGTSEEDPIAQEDLGIASLTREDAIGMRISVSL